MTLDLRHSAASPYEVGLRQDDVYVASGASTVPQGSGSAAEVLDSAAGRGKALPQALDAPAFVLSAMAGFRAKLS